jgi:hypothetical protein
MEKEVIFEGKKYLFDGTSWHDMSTFLKPPAAVIARLDESIKEDLQKEDEAIVSFEQCMQIAQKSKFNGDLSRAYRLYQRARKLRPESVSVIAAISSVLRDMKRPEDALDVTEPYRHAGHPAIHTTRAGALCDLGRWEDAKKEVGISLAIESSDESFLVVKRIKATRPDLYAKGK